MPESTVFERQIWDKNDVEVSWLDHASPQLNIAGGERARAGWVDPQRVIYDHELMLMGSGGQFEFSVLQAAGSVATYECRGPSYIILPPGTWHTCRGIVCQGVPRVWLHFDWVFVERSPQTPIVSYWPACPESQLFRQAPSFVPAGIITGSIPNEALAFEIQARISERYNHGTPRMRATSRALLLELLLYLLSPEAGGPASAGPAVALALCIREALDALAQKPFSKADPMKPYLARLGHSYDHLARVFRATYAVTPLQYLNAQRMERAKHLIRDTDQSIAAVARQLGFRDVVYFNRLFKKLVGTTPGGFRVGPRGV